jgi:abortive infection bacteriophage resistance protein
MKEKMTYPEMIVHMKDKGIAFHICDEKGAKEVLDSVNYYFKITAYRKNFAKRDEKYLNLDFAYLSDIAAIDFMLRQFLLELSLEVEHEIRTLLLSLITMNPAEDGYTIIEEFREAYPKTFCQVMGYLRNNKYSRALYEKHKDNISAWTFIEVSTFGALSQLLNFYKAKYPTKKLSKITNYLKYAKNMRNAAAHSNPILINLFTASSYVQKPSPDVVLAARNLNVTREDVKDVKINDLVSLIEIIRVLGSKASKIHIRRVGERVITRFERHEDYYITADNIVRFKSIFETLVDTIR